MRSGWRIGSVFGIPLVIDTSWFVILVGFTWLYRESLLQQGCAPGVSLLTGFGMALALFGSVLLHELGHSLVARSQGIPVDSITLFLFGGIAAINRESKTPGQAVQVAIAGPAVSFVLALLLWGIDQTIDLVEPYQTALSHLMRLNFLLALFNMLPGLPLDGGQVLRAVIWKLTGSQVKGVRWAAAAGMVLGWLIIALGLTLLFQVPALRFGALWIAFVGWYVLSKARSYNQLINLQLVLLGIRASDAMTREFRVVDADLSLQKFTEDYLLREEGLPPAFFVASDGRYRGMVQPEELQAVERSLWSIQTLREFAHPLSEIPSLGETSPLTEAIDKLEDQQLRRITVLSPAGAVAGVIDRGDVVRAFATKLGVPIAEKFIQQIKETGLYPPGLPLQEIAKSAEEMQDDCRR